MSPETAVNPPWREIFACATFRQHLSIIAIDEAHCIVDGSLPEEVVCFIL